MRQLILFSVFHLNFLAMFACHCQNDTSAKHKMNFVLSTELYGHNYFGYSTSKETGIISLSVGVQRVITSRWNVGLNVGWGSFKEKHSSQVPFQPRVYYYDRIHYFPIEAAVRYGKGRHCIQLSFSATIALGNQELVYNDGRNLHYRMIDSGWQFIPELSYVFLPGDGLMLKASITPRLLPKSIKTYLNAPIELPPWVPAGVTVGWIFGN